MYTDEFSWADEQEVKEEVGKELLAEARRAAEVMAGYPMEWKEQLERGME